MTIHATSFPWRRLSVITLATAAILIPVPATWVEHLYSRRLYLVIQNIVTRLTGITRFALFDLLLAGAFLGIAAWWIREIRCVTHGRRWQTAASIVFNTAALTAGVYLAFLAVWGLNYHREPLTVKLDYNQQRVTPEALIAFTAEAIEHLNELHGKTRDTEWSSMSELSTRLEPAFAEVQARLGVLRTAVVSPPKSTLLGAYFRWAGIDGMVSPFSLEVLVNDTVLPFERPFIITHEWAHLAGYANESEANFVGWLTCLSGDDGTQYSAWLFLMPHLLRHLPDEERDHMWSLMDDGPLTDLRAVATRFSQTVPFVRRNANRLYDRYLKVNRVDGGVKSYGMVVDLVLGTDQVATNALKERQK